MQKTTGGNSMKDMKTVASYICNRYQREFGEKIDEMKLHKLMYFAQRESLITTDAPLFDAEIQGWRLGPVVPQLREFYKAGEFAPVTDEELGEDKAALDAIFAEYAGSDSWNLSRLSHGEICWKISRKGVAPNESSKVTIPVSDIRLDAARMQERRKMLDKMGLL
jgi:uncharacterized phage-associated protein